MGDLEQSAIERMTDKEIVQALRCRARHEKATNEGCKKCPYWATENLEEWQKLCGWASCKVYQIISDAADAIERLLAENAALREKQRWIPVEDRLPKPEIDVLIVCNRNGYRFVTPAIYEDGKMLTQDSGWNWCDIDCYGLYDEDVDDYYIPEGWWESRKFNPDDVYNNPVDCTVTHWMSFPEAPEEGEM